jgi:phenylalanyl-tRNA synthetase beta chain
MKISIEWLKEYVEIPEDVEKLKQDLTMSGLLVESISEYEGTPVLEIEVTSNRPDCLSHIGIAREVAAIYGRPLRMPSLQRQLHPKQDNISFAIEIVDPDLCPRYCGIVMTGFHVAESPSWLRHRLECAGMRPVNNIVDVTNYVLLEFGHPLHAFDFKLLQQGKISVARAAAGQKMTTLDGIERELDSEMLLINDGAGPVAIAGVMGGLESEISLSTDTVLLESAYFQPASVRRTSKKLGLSTEASYRFERGADWENPVPSIARACFLIKELAGGKIAGGLKDVNPIKLAPAVIELKQSRAEAILGVHLDEAFVKSTLEKLNFKPKRSGKGVWQVTCPSYRADMELEADLIEELARFYGYQNIPARYPASTRAGVPSPIFHLESSIRQILRGLGYSEAINLSFAGESEQREFPVPTSERIEILNPLTEDTQFLRTSLAGGLVRSVKRNLNHDVNRVRLFELGKVYERDAAGAPSERLALGLLGAGGWAGHNWQNLSGHFDFFHLKGIISTLLSGLRCESYEIVPADNVGWLDPLQTGALMVGGKRIGYAGALNPSIEESYKLKEPVYLAEINLKELSPYLFRPVRYEALAKYPPVERDLSVMIEREIPFAAIYKGIQGVGIAELVSVELIDIYEGNKIPPGKVSITLRFIFQDREKTLTVERVQGFSDNILAFLRESHGAERR